MYQASQYAIDTLKQEEGFRPTAYPDAGGHSIGYGTYLDTADEQNRYLHATIDEKEGEVLLRMYVAQLVRLIEQRIKVPLNQNQVDALVLLTYNLGPKPIEGGTLDDLINAGESANVIKAKWLEYSYSNGTFLQQLQDRRQREVNLYFSVVSPEKKKPC